MQELVGNFSILGEMVADMVSGMFSTAKACFEVQRNHRIDGCQVDAECFAASPGGLAKTHARPVLNRKLDDSDRDEEKGACKIVVRACNKFQERKRMRS